MITATTIQAGVRITRIGCNTILKLLSFYTTNPDSSYPAPWVSYYAVPLGLLQSQSTVKGSMRVLCFSAFCYGCIIVPPWYPQWYWVLQKPSFQFLFEEGLYIYFFKYLNHVKIVNGLLLAKMEKYIPDTPLP